ncbi:hypothetical protein [Bdellovibrio bacteriovorus]|uniref:Uncharacterized protein n=1 Tax=Bdellovibrio bacteriovorus TaxID=959 RepID=A0A1Z3N789_BDEBC|nr:hypothetical protein [Bdellovibrio bacteriovorus]ASD63281.1 hypothetical protein B9G79_06710 [Bdellovibrio bacteriovorus]
MTNKMKLYSRTLAIFFVGLTLLAGELSLASLQRKSLTVRQPTKGAAVHGLASKQKLLLGLNKAKTSAEGLDLQIGRYLEISSMGAFQRWQKNIDFDAVKDEYSQRVLNHLQAMTELMKLRRSSHGQFKKLYEFDFQNLIRKSDYVLSVNTTRTTLEHSSEDPAFAAQAERTLADYNEERMRYDSKMIALN